MHSKITLLILTILLLWLSACSSPTVRCSGEKNNNDSFCYQGYNFGLHKNAKYKLGVVHGCKTANGYFTKLYHYSRNSTPYKQGWDKGRATCKLIPPPEAEPGTMRTQYQQSIDEKKYYGN